MDGLWGECGPAVSWKFNASMVELGSRVDIVVELVSLEYSSGAAVVCMWPCKARARIFDGLKDVGEDIESLTIFGALFVDNIGMPGFRVDQHSEVLCHPRIVYDDMFNLVELCAGMGIGTQGFNELGLTTVVANDVQPLTLAAYKELHPETETVCGDIADAGTVIEIFQRHPRSTVIMAGFSCQPYSGGGQCRGYGDKRSDTLVGVLRAAFHLRCPILVLECVKNAGTNRFVRQMIESFRDELGFNLTEGHLSLETCWVSRRERWWAILTAPILGAIQIPQLPHLVFPTKIRHILPRPFPCSDHELAELVLSTEEMKALISLVPEYTNMYLPLNGKCPTCLHSWGSQFSDCPCGCRKAFSATTLRERGVYGVFVPTGKSVTLDGNVHPELRHPHPCEVGWANGVMAPQSWPEPLKLSLVGLGQQASPIHCLWIAAQIVHHVDKLHFGSSQTSGSKSLDGWIQKIFTQIQNLTGTLGHVCSVSPVGVVSHVELIPPDAPMPVSTIASSMPWHSFQHRSDGQSVTIVDAASRVPAVIRLSNRSIQLHELLEAERSLSPDVKSFQVVDCVTSLAVGEDETVAGRCLWCELVCAPRVGCQVIEDCAPEVAVPVLSPTLPWTVPASGSAVVAGPVEHEAMAVDPQPIEYGVDDPLTQLMDVQLVGVLAPKIDSLRNLQALLGSNISGEDRVCVLGNQNGTWADDEVSWHAHRMLNEAGRSDWAFLPPILAAECLKKNGVQLLHQWIETLVVAPKVLLGAVPVGGHWIPFMWTWTAEMLTCHSWDVAGNTPRCLNLLHDALSKALCSRSYICNITHRLFATSDHCGLCSVRWLDHKIRGRMLPTSLDEVHYLHAIARRQFADFVASQPSVSRPWIWASGLDVKATSRLRDILAQHGVPVEQLDGRVALVTQAIGLTALQDALTSANPWRLLKQLANQQRPALQIVLPEELATVVQTRAREGKVNAVKKGVKGKGKGLPTKPPSLDPSKVLLEVESFVTSENQLVHEIDSKSIGPLSEGVFLTTQVGIEAHLRAGVPLSKGALAAVVLNVDGQQLQTALSWSQIRVVLRCKMNKEPILVAAYLVQLGHMVVGQVSAVSGVKVSDVPVACLKVAVYRDAIDVPWKDFAQAPIRYILSVLLPLVTCQSCEGEPDPNCVKWHSKAPENVVDPVLDIWRRQWTSFTFKQCDSSEAAIFWVNLRYVGKIEQAVLRCSGYRGVFVEPRSLDGKSGTLDYQVVWLPKDNLAEVQRLQQCHLCVVGLARLGSRLGLRVAASDAATLTKVVKPGAVFLSSGERHEFEAGPLPYGVDRLSLTKLCEAWKWQARPLHPIRSLEDGLGTVWLLQSCHDPPEMVLKYQGGNVVISRIVRKSAQPSGSSMVVGGSATMALCQLEAAVESKPVDPWLKHDPWQSAAMPASSAPGGPWVGNQLQQIEERIEQKILAKVAIPLDGDVVMDGPDHRSPVDAKVLELESQLQLLSSKQQILEGKIEACAQSNDAQISQLQHQVAAQFEAQRGEMQGLFSSQMSQIEALLNKKARLE